MAQHVKILGILHIVFGSLGILAAIAMLAIFGGIAGLVGTSGHDPDSAAAIPILGGIGLALFCLILVLSLPGLAAGFGLLNYKPWARILAIVLSALDLFSIPFGTALGIYGFWVLLNRETEQLFNRAPVPMAPRV